MNKLTPGSREGGFAKAIDDKINALRNDIIENCALVAETWKQGGSTESSGIAAAIRKLKDAP